MKLVKVSTGLYRDEGGNVTVMHMSYMRRPEDRVWLAKWKDFMGGVRQRTFRTLAEVRAWNGMP